VPFGFRRAPATFQRMMNTVLIGLRGSRCFVFLDDVMYANSLVEHVAAIRAVFERLKVKLKVKLSLYLTKHHTMKAYWGVEV